MLNKLFEKLFKNDPLVRLDREMKAASKAGIERAEQKFIGLELTIENPYGIGVEGTIESINLTDMICNVHFPEDNVTVSFDMKDSGFIPIPTVS